MKNLKIGFIGYGKHAQANLYPSLKILGYPITAVCTRHPEIVKKAQDEYQIKHTYIDYIEMLQKEKLDCVFVATQPDQQLKIVSHCLQTGLHVFVEKPLGFNQKEAKQILDLSQKTKKQVMVGFMKRFAPSYKYLRTLVRNKEKLGEIIAVNEFFTCRNFVTNPREFLLFGVIHYVDLLHWYLGKIISVKGFQTVNGSNIAQVFLCQAESGAVGSIHFCASPSWAKHYEEITITGTNGYAKVENIIKLKYHLNPSNHNFIPRWQILDEEEIEVSSISTSGSGGLKDLYQNGFVGEIQHFLTCVENNQTPETSAFENYQTMILCDELLKSLEK